MIEISTGTLITWAAGIAGGFCLLGFGLGIMFWAWWSEERNTIKPTKGRDFLRKVITR